jgi:predicted dinucleotide-binding enzyme
MKPKMAVIGTGRLGSALVRAFDGYDEIFQEAVKAGRNQDDFSTLHEFIHEPEKLGSPPPPKK